ncbi:MAG: hypothetical protein ABI443_09665 [Chthoniobacterales bacterium]
MNNLGYLRRPRFFVVVCMLFLTFPLYAGVSVHAFDISKGLSQFDILLRPFKPSYPSPYYIGGILVQDEAERYTSRKSTIGLPVVPRGEITEILLPDDTLCIVSPAPFPSRAEGSQYPDGIYVRLEFRNAKARTSTDTKVIVYSGQSIVLRAADKGPGKRPVFVLLRIFRN